MSRSATLLSLCLLLSVGVGTSRAKIIIDIEPVDSTITAGIPASANVYISSDAPSGEAINGFNLTFQVSGLVADGVQFAQNYTYENLFLTNQYVFQTGAGNLSSYYTDPPLVPPLSDSYVGDIAPDTVYPNDTFVGSDLTSDLSPVTVTSTKTLLTMLYFNTPLSGPVDPGTTYTVTLVPGAGPYDINSPTVFYLYDPGNDSYTALDYQTNPGTFTVGTQAVPEPSTFALLGLGLLGMLGYGVRRKTSAR